MMKPTIYIGHHWYGRPHPAFLCSLAAVKAATKTAVVVEGEPMRGQSFIVAARNRVLTEFLDRRKEDWLMFWDDDIECRQADVLDHLLGDGKEYVGALYPKRSHTGKMVGDCVTSVVLPSQKPDGHMLRVHWLSGGFVMMRRDVLRWAVDSHKDQWYDDEWTGKVCYGLFNPMLVELVGPNGERKRKLLSEDFSFCQRMKASGCAGWADLRVVLCHWGDYGYQLEMDGGGGGK